MEKNKHHIFGSYEAALIVILCVNALLKWRFFSGLVAADDFSYAVYSFSMWRIPMQWDMTMDFRVLRLALLLPVALLFRVFPPTVFMTVAYPMAMSFGTIVLVYCIGKKLYGRNAGIVAALVMATFPADIIYGTMLLPDGVVPFFLALSVWSFINADENTGRKALPWYLASGFAMFLAFVTRENTYYFLLFFAPFAFNRRRWANGIYMFGVGFALPVIFVYSFYYMKTGDFLYNLHLAEYYRDPLIRSGYIPPNDKNRFSLLYFMMPLFFKGYGPRRFFMSGLYGVTMYLAAGSIVYTAIKAWRERNIRMLIAPWWFITVYLFLEFGSISFTEYQMMRKLDRFLLTLTPAAALACGVVLTDVFGLGAFPLFRRKIFRDLAGKFRRHRGLWITAPLATAVMAYVLFSSYVIAANQKTSRDNNLRKFRWGYYEVLQGKPNRPVYDTGGWWKNKLSFYFMPDLRYAEMPWRHTDMLRDLKAVKAPVELGGSYVIIDRSHFSGENDLRIRHSYGEFANYVKLPPKDWTMLGRNHGVEIYEVPEGWTYTEPDGKDLVKGAFLWSMEIGDFQLFMNCLHPDLRKRLPEQEFSALVRHLANVNDPVKDDLLNNRIVFTTLNGAWKIDFKLD